MSNYTPSTDFSAKDALLTGNPSKIVKGTEISAELTSIQAAIASKYDATTTVPVTAGGTGATSAAAARTALGVTPANIGAAASGANSDITSLSAITSINGGQLAGLRNRIINGGMQVAQRGSSAALTAGLQYSTADRHMIGVVGGTGVSGNATQGASVNFASGYTFGFNSCSWTSGTITHQHRIESLNTVSLNGKTVTYSGKFTQNLGSTRTFNIGLYKANSTDNFGAVTQIGSTVTVSAADSAIVSFTATWTLGSTDGNTGLLLQVSDSATSTAVSKYFFIGDLQLELGSVATPFEHRPYGMELALCQRYYEKSYADGVSPGTATYQGGGYVGNCNAVSGSTAGNVNGVNILQFKVEKRATPTVVVYDYDGTANAARIYPADAKRTGVSGLSGLKTSGSFQFLSFDNSSAQAVAVNSNVMFNWTASSEL